MLDSLRVRLGEDGFLYSPFGTKLARFQDPQTLLLYDRKTKTYWPFSLDDWREMAQRICVQESGDND